MKTKLNIGVIGCGGFTSGKHLPNIKQNKNLNLISLCDLDEKHLDQLTKIYNPKYTTTDYKKLINDKNIDAIIVGTKPSFRIPIIKEAIKENKHVFVEKPMGIGLKDTFTMYKLISGSKIKFMVGYNRPYSTIMQDTKKLFKKQLLENQKHKFKNVLINYRIIGEAQLWPEHHRSKVYGGESTIIHEVVHIFDFLNWLTDEYPVQVISVGGGNMDNAITLVYPNNITAVIMSGDNGSAGYPKESLEINLNHSVISMRSFVELYYAGINNKSKRTLYPYKLNGKLKKSTFEKYQDILWNIRKTVTKKEKEYGYYYDKFPLEDKGHYNELEYFYQIIKGNKKNQTNEYSGLVAQILAEKSIESLKNNKIVKIKYPKI